VARRREMSERGILFSGPMVRAILEDRKTQTRRVMKPQPDGQLYFTETPEGFAAWVDPMLTLDEGRHRLCPYGGVYTGEEPDTLWVKETFIYYDPEHKQLQYRADVAAPKPGGWRPSIYMPRWASRITLTITDVRVQRVQDISEEDAFVEGISGGDWLGDPVGEYAKLWSSINAKRGYSWDTNPWVWALTFRRER
jgi:hypothetical protein